MRRDLMFDHKDQRAIWQVTGATVGFFFLLHAGKITCKDLHEIFGQSEFQFYQLYQEWLKYNDPNDPNQLEFDLVLNR